MRNTHRCPKCDHPEVLYVPRLRDSDFDVLMVDKLAGWVSNEEVGRFEAYLCRSCGFTEFYASGVGKIDPKQIPGAQVLTPATPKIYR